MSYVNPQHHASFLSSLENTFSMDDVRSIEVAADDEAEQTLITVTVAKYVPLDEQFTEAL